MKTKKQKQEEQEAACAEDPDTLADMWLLAQEFIDERGLGDTFEAWLEERSCTT